MLQKLPTTSRKPLRPSATPHNRKYNAVRLSYSDKLPSKGVITTHTHCRGIIELLGSCTVRLDAAYNLLHVYSALHNTAQGQTSHRQASVHSHNTTTSYYHRIEASQESCRAFQGLPSRPRLYSQPTTSLYNPLRRRTATTIAPKRGKVYSIGFQSYNQGSQAPV